MLWQTPTHLLKSRCTAVTLYGIHGVILAINKGWNNIDCHSLSPYCVEDVALSLLHALSHGISPTLLERRYSHLHFIKEESEVVQNIQKQRAPGHTAGSLVRPGF